MIGGGARSRPPHRLGDARAGQQVVVLEQPRAAAAARRVGGAEHERGAHAPGQHDVRALARDDVAHLGGLRGDAQRHRDPVAGAAAQLEAALAELEHAQPLLAGRARQADLRDRPAAAARGGGWRCRAAPARRRRADRSSSQQALTPPRDATDRGRAPADRRTPALESAACPRSPRDVSATPSSRSPWSASAATTSAADWISRARAQSSTRRSTQGIDFFDTADIYGGGGESEQLLGEVLAGPPRRGPAGDEVRHAHGRRRRPARPAARLARVHPLGGRGLAAPAADRDDRPLPVPRARRRDPDRGDARRARRARARGQGALRRLLELLGRRSSRRPSAWHASAATPASSRCRTSTACSSAGSRPTSRQPASDSDVGILPFFPLASGLLSGKYRRGETAPEGLAAARAGHASPRDEQFELIEALQAYARRARAEPADGRDRRSGGAARRGVGDRGRDQARAGARERRACAGSWEPSARRISDAAATRSRRRQREQRSARQRDLVAPLPPRAPTAPARARTPRPTRPTPARRARGGRRARAARPPCDRP